MGCGARRAVIWVCLAALFAVLAPSAFAVVPEDAVGGSGSKWYSGSLLQQSGNNCSIIGGSYSETMVSAIAGYGGAPNNSVVHIGDRYWASILISIPGNPCGSGSSFVGTDLVLPRGTSVDTSSPIRCFGEPRNSNTFGELTGGNWSFTFSNGNTSTGPYCPAQVSGSLTGTSGAVGVGYRPLASGQLYELFVPLITSVQLDGAGHNPADEVRWVLSSSGTYDNTGSTAAWANVFPAGTGTGNTPFFYFARNPSVVPYWDATAVGQENRAEWFANLYSAGYPGTLCWTLYNGNPPTSVDSTCATPGGWQGAVTNASDSWQVFGHGPNGGYVPFFYGPSETYTIRWTFDYNNGGAQQVHKDIAFTTLPGPDTDGDGVADSADACPNVKGTQANGCQPPVQSDPDGDGVFGAADKCPDANGGGSQDGCPPAAPPSSTPPPATPAAGAPAPGPVGTPAVTIFGGAIGAIKGNKIKRALLAKGVVVPVTCSLDAKAALTLSVTAAVARKLKIPVKKKQATVPIGSAAATCTAKAGGKPKLKLKPALARKITRQRKPVAATLVVVLTRPGIKALTVSRKLSLI